MKVEDDDDGDEQPRREGMVGDRFMGFVEGMGFGEFVLVVDQAELLDAVEHAEFVLFVFGRVAPFDVDVYFAPRG